MGFEINSAVSKLWISSSAPNRNLFLSINDI